MSLKPFCVTNQMTTVLSAVLLFVGSSTSASADSSAAASSEGSEFPTTIADTRFSWRDCGESATHYFSVDVWRDGHFRYVGGPLVRDVGERTGKVDSSKCARLMKAAEKIATSPAKLDRAGSPADTTASEEYCIHATYVRMSQELSGTISSSDSSDKKSADLFDLVDSILKLMQWVCPARAAAESSPLRGRGYCPESVISLMVAIPEACYSYHQVDIFEDGVVHLMAIRINNPMSTAETRQPAGDRYYRVSLETVEKLRSKAQPYPDTREAMSDGYLTHSQYGSSAGPTPTPETMQKSWHERSACSGFTFPRLLPAVSRNSPLHTFYLSEAAIS